MARRLGQTVNEMTITDQLSNSDIVFFYRMPSIQERVKYQSNLFGLRGGNKLQVKTFETRLAFGLEILTGFNEGDFEVEKDGHWVPISSQLDSPNYYAGWRTYLKQHAPDLINALAAAVFDSASASAPMVDDEKMANIIDVGDNERKNSRLSLSDTTTLTE